MMSRRPNWYAAACGLAYIVCFLLLPVYTVSYVLPLRGMDMLSVAPVLVIMMACGLAMALSALLLEKKISMGVGVGCAVITLLFGVLGKQVLPVSTMTGLVDQGIAELTGLNLSVGGFVTVAMGFGAILCLLLCVAHIVLELLLEGGPRYRKPQENLWEDSNNGPINF